MTKRKARLKKARRSAGHEPMAPVKVIQTFEGAKSREPEISESVVQAIRESESEIHDDLELRIVNRAILGFCIAVVIVIGGLVIRGLFWRH